MPNTFQLYWVSDDNQAHMSMGEFNTLEGARGGQPAAEQEIANLGGDPDGFWRIDELDENGEIIATHDL